MKILYSWLRDFVDVPDGPAELGRRMSLRGLALEGLEPAPPGEAPPGAAAGRRRRGARLRRHRQPARLPVDCRHRPRGRHRLRTAAAAAVGVGRRLPAHGDARRVADRDAFSRAHGAPTICVRATSARPPR